MEIENISLANNPKLSGVRPTSWLQKPQLSKQSKPARISLQERFALAASEDTEEELDQAVDKVIAVAQGRQSRHFETVKFATTMPFLSATCMLSNELCTVARTCSMTTARMKLNRADRAQ
jgi:hypothetical protein